MATNYWKQERKLIRQVFFSGSTALKKGQGVCYDRDYGTAATADTRRDRTVELPSSSNNRWFAGVAARDYPAKSGGQFIEIYEPGSVCYILAGQQDAVVASTIFTCSAATGDAGRFGLAGFPGRGSAMALQTVTVLKGSGLDGGGSVSSKTLTDTNAFTNVEVGDRIVILGGAGTPGIYTVASKTDNSNVVLDSAPGNGACTWYAIDDTEPLVLAYLFDGEESGLCEWITPQDNDEAAAMVGGMTFICGGVTLSNGNSTDTLDDGDVIGLRKGFLCKGTIGTNDHVVTVTHGLQNVMNTTSGAPETCASVAFDAANELCVLEWYGQKWQVLQCEGATMSSS